MTMTGNQICRNFAGSSEYAEDSFVGIFHEQGLWNDDEYFRLEDCLYEQCAVYAGEDRIPRHVFWPAMRIYSYLLLSMGCLLDPEDGMELEGLSREQICQRRERLQRVFEGFFCGAMPDRNDLGY